MLLLLPYLRETLLAAPTVAPAQTPNDIMQWLRRSGLTRREMEVAWLLTTGASTEEIENRLHIARPTLKTHLRNIYRKVGVRNRGEMALVMMNELLRGIDGPQASPLQQDRPGGLPSPAMERWRTSIPRLS